MLPRSYKSTMRSCRKQNKERYESMQPYMIETVDITKRFPGTLANDHICLRARAGEIMGLVGENGAGKSTILKCLNGVYPSDSYEGKILIEGKEVQLNSPLDAIRLGIGFVPQEINVLQDMNVAENIFCLTSETADRRSWSITSSFGSAQSSSLKNRDRSRSVGERPALVDWPAADADDRTRACDGPENSNLG